MQARAQTRLSDSAEDFWAWSGTRGPGPCRPRLSLLSSRGPIPGLHPSTSA